MRGRRRLRRRSLLTALLGEELQQDHGEEQRPATIKRRSNSLSRGAGWMHGESKAKEDSHLIILESWSNTLSCADGADQSQKKLPSPWDTSGYSQSSQAHFH